MKEYMKLQKRLGRKYKDKEYYKWVINIPSEDIEYAGLHEGDDLKIESEKGKITLKKRV